MKVLIFSIVVFIVYIIIDAICSRIFVKKNWQKEELNEERFRKREKEALWDVLRHCSERKLKMLGQVLDTGVNTVNPASYVIVEESSIGVGLYRELKVYACNEPDDALKNKLKEFLVVEPELFADLLNECDGEYATVEEFINSDEANEAIDNLSSEKLEYSSGDYLLIEDETGYIRYSKVRLDNWIKETLSQLGGVNDAK